MAEYDLTKTVIPYLDRHFAFPLLTHLSETALFPEEQITAAQYELAKGTNMVDFAISLFEQLNEGKEAPGELVSKRESAISTNDRLQQEAQVILNVIEIPDVAQAMRQDKIQNLQYLKEHFNIEPEQITALYHFGQFQYSYGNYSGAADYLYHFLILSTDADLNVSALWGKLASDILTGKWDVALTGLNELRELIDSRSSLAPSALSGSTLASSAEANSLSQLQSRTWILHWSLFVYFNHEQGRQLLLETFLSPAYLNTIQTACPWVLRYLAAAAILSRKAAASAASGSSARVRHALKEVVKVVQMEEYQFSDPVTNFLKELYLEFDFEKAQTELMLASQVVENDFFLGEFKDEFLDNARYLISEAYCRIHHKIDIADLSARLSLPYAEGEKYLVNLIREISRSLGAGADAKIDLEKNVIQITRPSAIAYQSVIEKTRGLAFRTQAIGAALEKGTGDKPEGRGGEKTEKAPVAVEAR